MRTVAQWPLENELEPGKRQDRSRLTQTGRNRITSCLPTIHSVAESGGLSDERCFPPIGRSASQCCRPVNDDNLTASFCNRHLRFRSVTVRARKRACEWFAEFARRLNRHDQFATDICDIRTADFIELPCRCKTYPLRDALADIGRSSSLSSYCAQLSSWASPMRSPSGPRM